MRNHNLTLLLRRIGALLALTAIAIQCVVIQPHVHYAAVQTGVLQHDAALTSNSAPHEKTALCFVCRQAEASRGLSLASAPVIVRSNVAELSGRAASRIESTTPSPSHNWQSRAPPASA